MKKLFKIQIAVLVITLAAQCIIYAQNDLLDAAAFVTDEEWSKIKYHMMQGLTFEQKEKVKFDNGNLHFYSDSSSFELIVLGLLTSMASFVALGLAIPALKSNVMSEQEKGLLLTAGAPAFFGTVTGSLFAHRLIHKMRKNPYITLDQEGILQDGMVLGIDRKLYWDQLKKINLTKTEYRNSKTHTSTTECSVEFIGNNGKILFSITDKYLPAFHSFINSAEYYYNKAKALNSSPD